MIRRALPGIIVSVLLLGACKKPEFDSEFLVPEDALSLYSDSSIIVNTLLEREDSVRSDELSMNLLGSFHDPLLGMVQAGIYAQVRMAASNLDFGTSPQADSMVLILPYNGGYYGDISNANGMQQFTVYRLNETMATDSVYYSNDTLAYDALPIGSSGPIKPAPADSVVISGKKQRPQLRIKLSNELAQEFLNNQASFTDNASFLQFFKGLHIKSGLIADQPGNGAILDFRLTSGSGIELHYHNSSDDSLVVAFGINENSARFTAFNRSYSQEVINQLNTPLQNQQNAYVANMAGLRTRIALPNLYSWAANRKLIINKARLIVPVDPTDLDKYPANPILSLVTKDSTGKLLNTLDNLSGEDYAGGSFDATKKEYTFNLARQIQALLDGKIKDYGLFLQGVGTGVSSYRVKINAGQHPDKPARLEILYQIIQTQQ